MLGIKGDEFIGTPGVDYAVEIIAKNYTYKETDVRVILRDYANGETGPRFVEEIAMLKPVEHSTDPRWDQDFFR